MHCSPISKITQPQPPLAQARPSFRPSSHLLNSITAAGVDLQRVAALANCKFDQADTLPSCLVDLLSAPKKDAKTNGTMAMNGTDASPLTVASAEAGAGGPTFTLDGELNTVAELVAAMEASKPLLALLTPAQAKVLAAASKAKLDSMPDLVAYVGECFVFEWCLAV